MGNKIANAPHEDAVIEGSAIRSADRVRINVQLIDASSDQHLWAESYERDLKNVFALQGEVAQAIAQQSPVEATGKARAAAMKALVRARRLACGGSHFPGKYQTVLRLGLGWRGN